VCVGDFEDDKTDGHGGGRIVDSRMMETNIKDE
jgi:hypothetical protein